MRYARARNLRLPRGSAAEATNRRNGLKVSYCSFIPPQIDQSSLRPSPCAVSSLRPAVCGSRRSRTPAFAGHEKPSLREGHERSRNRSHTLQLVRGAICVAFVKPAKLAFSCTAKADFVPRGSDADRRSRRRADAGRRSPRPRNPCNVKGSMKRPSSHGVYALSQAARPRGRCAAGSWSRVAPPLRTRLTHYDCS